MTVSSDVQMRVRAVGDGGQGPTPADPALGSARTRAIPLDPARRKSGKARILTSLHVVEAGEAVRSGWAATESPPPAGAMWRQVFPGKGEASSRWTWIAASVAGLFRAVVITGCWLFALSVATRIRAGVVLGVAVLTTTAGLIVGASR